MLVSYCFSSSERDVPVDAVTLERPFILTPFENHPFMTLGDYFDIVRGFILLDNGKHLVHLLVHLWDKNVEFTDITKLIIRYEKYGTLYQIFSAEVFSEDRHVKFAISTAISKEAKETLNQEFDLIQNLFYQTGLPYLPRQYYRETINLVKDEMSETILMTLSEWFENYHEWHFAQDNTKKEHITIWDMDGGYRFASDQEVYEIIRQASRILTLYYDSDAFFRIHPWHHSAGDFVVKTIDGTVDVRLITARGYIQMLPSGSEEIFDTRKVLMLFLLDLLIKMRLDKLEGVGEPYWAESHILKPVLEGFLDALKAKERESKNPVLNNKVFLNHLRSVSMDEINTLLSFLMDQYRIYDRSDFEVINERINDHIVDVYQIFQNYS